jgi:hypothetical protein
MRNKAKARHYFVEGWTVCGSVSLLPGMTDGWRRTYVLLGGPGSGKSTLIKTVGLELLDRGFEIDFWRSASDPDATAGLLLHRYGITVLDEPDLCPFPWQAPGVIEKFIDFTAFCDTQKLQAHSKEMRESLMRQRELQELLRRLLREQYAPGLRRQYDQADGSEPWRNLLSAQFDLPDGRQESWFLARMALEKLQKSAVSQYFLQGLTPEGWLNLAPRFLTDYDQIRLEGNEQSEVLKWVLREARQLGQVIEIVLHPLLAEDSIGMIFPERNLAIWRGDPEIMLDQGIEEEINDPVKETLAAWTLERRRLQAVYTRAMDFTQVDECRIRLLNQILGDIEQLGPDKSRRSPGRDGASR